MSRARLLAAVGAAALPLLILVLVVAEAAGPRPVLVALALWAVGVAVLAGFLWRESACPLADLLHELGAASPDQALSRLRESRERLAEVASREEAAARLLEDLALRLGEGLLVVGPDLKLRLANPRALHFLGRETVSDGTPLVDLVRQPDAVEAVRLAATGETGGRVVVENPRGLWELRVAPVHGGAIVLVDEVGLLQRSAELRRRFVQDLSHELRSPLAVLRTTVEALEGEVPSQLSEMLVRQVERITHLVDELHELAAIEAGQLALEPQRLALAEVAREVVEGYRAAAEAAGISLRLEVPAGVEMVSDRRALTRVLANLVDNAVRYNRRGGWVEVRGWSADRSTHLEVADSGEGIPPDEVGAVTQRFYRRDQARTPGEGGAGLGLAIVKHLVQQLGGTLSLDSREAVGTRVTVIFAAPAVAE